MGLSRAISYSVTVIPRVVSIHRTGRTAPMFNLEVADFHTYFVGEDRVWVHNACSEDVHHIVAQTDRRAAGTRAHMEEHGVGVQHPANKVGLPRSLHARIHTNTYHSAVARRILQQNSGSDIISELGNIAQELINNAFGP